MQGLKLSTLVSEVLNHFESSARKRLIKVIQEKTEIANASNIVASEKSAYAEEQAILISAQKAEADEALMEALPAENGAGRRQQFLPAKLEDHIFFCST